MIKTQNESEIKLKEKGNTYKIRSLNMWKRCCKRYGKILWDQREIRREN